MRLEGFQGMQRILPSRRYCICEGIEEIRSNEFEAFPKFVSSDWSKGIVKTVLYFYEGEELKFKLRSNNEHMLEQGLGIFFLERGS